MALVLLVVTEVVLRRFFNSPTIWNFEVTKQLYGLHFMILAPYVMLHKGHVSIDLFYEKCSEKGQAVLDIVGAVIFGFPFLIIALYEGIKYAALSWEMLETSWSAFAPPLYFIKTVIPIVACLLLLQSLSLLVRNIQTILKGYYHV